jgi:hypothetical protein
VTDEQKMQQTVLEFNDVVSFFGPKSSEARRFRAKHGNNPRMQQMFDVVLRNREAILNSQPTP